MTSRGGARVPSVFAADRPLVFAHRGGARLAPENTLPAFARGLAAGADGLECDVHLSRDGVPVVIHDPTLERTTDAAGPVGARTAAELARVDAGCRFRGPDGSPWGGARAAVPALAEVLHTFPAARVIVEMKGQSAALGQAVAGVVRAAGAGDRVCLGAFSHVTLAAARAAAPELATSASLDEARGTLYRSWIRWPLARPRPYAAFQVPEAFGRLRVVRPAFVRQAHREGQLVQVWVVDREADVRRLLDWGVDGIISDRPDLAVAARDAWRGQVISDLRSQISD
ncbi:MAG: glycerophosphodiester phosphodiesterase [Vicinamibacterales bacterium]